MSKILTWRERISRAVLRGKFTKKDKELVWSGETCAVGEHQGEYAMLDSDTASHISYATPKSNSLFNMGVRFSSAVDEDKVSKALQRYEQIQRYFQRRRAK